jgi:serine/threonine-protein kinase RsbW
VALSRSLRCRTRRATTSTGEAGSLKELERFDFVIVSDTLKGQQIQLEIVAAAQSCDVDESDQFAIRLALEEAMVNAIKHGNGSDPNKKVSIDYEVSSQEVRIRIEDEGPGFDPASLPDPTAPEFLERPCGRGILLMRHYMSRVEFLGRGNCVEMVKLVNGSSIGERTSKVQTRREP